MITPRPAFGRERVDDIGCKHGHEADGNCSWCPSKLAVVAIAVVVAVIITVVWQ
jgi:hypothetical protein